MEGDSSESVRRRLPAWGISVAFHVVLVLVLGVMFKLAPKSISGDEVRELAGEVVLKHQTEQGEFFESRDTQSLATESAGAAPFPELQELPPVQPGLELPSREFGASAAGDSQGGLNRGLTQGISQPRGPQSGGARTRLFGIDSEGYSFVYVFDRSASMSSPQNLPLNAAKAELRASLNQLEDTHQFQIIFYNDEPTMFNVTGVAGRLPFANERNKSMAMRFIDGITADGATNHMSALLKAIGLKPDVIYFLTDAEDSDAISDANLARIENANRGGITIHCIKFGHHDELPKQNYLTKLAQANGGRYTYVNVRTLGQR